NLLKSSIANDDDRISECRTAGAINQRCANDGNRSALAPRNRRRQEKKQHRQTDQMQTTFAPAHRHLPKPITPLLHSSKSYFSAWFSDSTTAALPQQTQNG